VSYEDRGDESVTDVTGAPVRPLRARVKKQTGTPVTPVTLDYVLEALDLIPINAAASELLTKQESGSMEHQHGSRDPDDAYFGACPECGTQGPYTNAGRTHWFYCSKHKTRWCEGANLFSSWRHETKEEQRAEWERIGIGEFREVEPVYDGETIRRLRARAR
jgi:hypothetical protein